VVLVSKNKPKGFSFEPVVDGKVVYVGEEVAVGM